MLPDPTEPATPGSSGSLSDRDFNYRLLRKAILTAVRAVLSQLRSSLVSSSTLRSLERTNKDRTDQTREIDIMALGLYRQELETYLVATPALLCSEENPTGDILGGGDSSLPDLIYIVDPIDNTDGAVHGAPCYTALSVYQRSARTVIAAAVGDFFHNEIYYADEERNGAYRYPLSPETKADPGFEIRPASRQKLPGAYIAIYTLKPKRLQALAKASELLDQLGDDGRIDCIGGAAGLARVATGYIDAAVEFAKGFQTYDLFPGAYLLMKAGGFCYRPDTGDSVSLSLEFSAQEELSTALKMRQSFVGACTHTLSNKILLALTADGVVGTKRSRTSRPRSRKK